MSSNLFLPEKNEKSIEHNLNIAGTYTWTAPDKNRDGSDYTIEVALYGGGGGASGVPNPTTPTPELGQSGGSGGYTRGELTVTPGNVYTLIVGAGGNYTAGGSQGGTGGLTSIELSASEIVRANGGTGGQTAYSGDLKVNTSGSSVVTNATLYSEKFTLGALRRTYNGDSTFTIYNSNTVKVQELVEASPGEYVSLNPRTGGVGGNYLSDQAAGGVGRIILRYSLKENITDNIPS